VPTAEEKPVAMAGARAKGVQVAGMWVAGLAVEVAEAEQAGMAMAQ